MKRKSDILMRLFKKYALMDGNESRVGIDSWCAMTNDLCKMAQSSDPRAWRHGGKPSLDALEQCLILSKKPDSLEEEWIDFHDLQRCLLRFAAAIYPDRPGRRYRKLPFKTKLDLVLKWCKKLDRSKEKVTSAGMFHSESLEYVKAVKFRRGLRSASVNEYTPTPDNELVQLFSPETMSPISPTSSLHSEMRDMDPVTDVKGGVPTTSL